MTIPLQWIGACPSTNDLAWELGRKNGRPIVIASDHQTAGRGRLGRSWISPPGKDLLFSIYFPTIPLDRFPFAAAAVAIAICDVAGSVMSGRGRHPSIQWPNDLYVDRHKLGGLLAERRDAGMDGVLGVGINVNSRTDDWPVEIQGLATSLCREIDEEIDRRALLAQILEVFGRLFPSPEAAPIEALELRWKEQSNLPGRRVQVVQGESAVDGTVISAGLREGLVLQTAAGLRTFLPEHVTRVIPF